MNKITWSEVRAGDVLAIRGVRWTVEATSGTAVSLISPSGKRRTGAPQPGGAVTVLERGPEPARQGEALAKLAPLKPEPLCGHWIGAERRWCGSDDGVRRYLQGYRCRQHTPGLVRAQAEGRKACLGCGQPLPADEEPGEHCLVCSRSTNSSTRRRK